MSAGCLEITKNLPLRTKLFGPSIEPQTIINGDLDWPDSNVSDDVSAFSRFIEKYKFQINVKSSDLQNKIRKGDLLEVYNLNGDLVFANAHFFRATSMQDLVFNKPWKTLYKRKAQDILRANIAFLSVLKGSSNNIIDINKKMGKHFIQERFGERLNFSWEGRYAVKILDSSRIPICVLFISEHQLIKEKLSC